MFTLPGFIVYTQTCTHKTDLHEQQLRYATPSSYTTIKMMYKTIAVVVVLGASLLRADTRQQTKLFDIIMGARSILTTKVQGIENYQLRRSSFWLQRSLIDWQEQLVEYARELNELAATPSDLTPKLQLQIPVYATALNALADSIRQWYSSTGRLGLVQALAQTTLQMSNDLLLEVTSRARMPLPQERHLLDESLPDFMHQHPEIDELFTQRLKGVLKAG